MKIDHASLDKLAKVLFFIVLRFLLVGTAITFLWNWLMPTLINAVPINFLQAIGLMVLGRLITGSLRIGVGLSAFRKKNDDDHNNFMDEDDQDNDYESKARLRNDLRERCKHFGQKKENQER